MAQRVHLNIPAAHFHNVLCWDEKTIEQLVDKAVDLAVKVGLRLDEDKEGVYLKEAESKGAEIDWESWNIKPAAAELGIDAPILPVAVTMAPHR